MTEYKGSLSSRRMSGQIRAIYFRYRKQVERCSDKKNISYKHYGAKGVRVEYGPREFISWFLREERRYRGEKPFAVGRIDHSKNYSIDNIALVSRSENSKERHRRCGPTLKKVSVRAICIQTQEEIGVFSSIAEAEKKTGISKGTISKHVNNTTKKPNRRSSIWFRPGIVNYA